jgi:asparagine synthetase B (glutamine-hydrolysing)
MYLILQKEKPWDDVRIALNGEKRSSHDLFSEADTDVFVRGFPYSRGKVGWLSAEDIGGLYRKGPAALVPDLEGSFAIIVLDRRERSCTVVVDPYKVYTLFHARLSDDRLIISDSVKEIVAHMPGFDIDRTGILEFVAFGFVLGEKTLIGGVRAFAGGAVHSIDSDLVLREETYWTYAGNREGHGKASVDDLIDAFNGHMINGMRLEERISMPLTGGLDSRTVLSACMREKGRLHCYTHGRRRSDDVNIAGRIARRFGIAYDCYEIGDEVIRNIPALAGSMTDACNGLFNTVMSAHFLSSYEKERGRGDLFFSGIGGELMRSYYLPRGLQPSGSLEGYARALRRRIQVGSDMSVFREPAAPEAAELLERSIRNEFSRYGTEDVQALAECFYLKNRVGNFLSVSMRLLGDYFKIFNPFLERGMLQIVSRVPAAEKVGIGIQSRIVMRNCPELAGILMDRARIIERGNRTLMAKHLVLRAMVLAKIYANKLTGKGLFNFSFTDYDSWLKRYHKGYVADTLDYERMHLRVMLDRGGLERLTRTFLDTRSDLCTFATNIMSVEIFLRRMHEEAGRYARER